MSVPGLEGLFVNQGLALSGQMPLLVPQLSQNRLQPLGVQNLWML